VRPTALQTPCLVLDPMRLERNLGRMSGRARELGVAFRPHLKTAKSLAVAARATAGEFGGITVSTLHEAEYFLAGGYADLLYAVGIEAGKLPRAASLVRNSGGGTQRGGIRGARVREIPCAD
jgi:D-serine deaminase-like pyridoxal phosphate-dependent protein